MLRLGAAGLLKNSPLEAERQVNVRKDYSLFDLRSPESQMNTIVPLS